MGSTKSIWVPQRTHFYCRYYTKSYVVIIMPSKYPFKLLLFSSVHKSSKDLTKFILKGITNSEESINTTVFPAEHFYIVLDKDEDAFPVNLVMKKTAQRLQFNY